MLSDLPIPATEDREEEEIKVYTEDIQETTNNMLTSHDAHLSRTHDAHLSRTHDAHLSRTHGAHLSRTHDPHLSRTHDPHLSRTHGAHPLPSHLGSNPPTQCNTRPHIPLLPPKDKTSMLTNILVLHVINTYNRVSNTQQEGTTSSSSKT